jgi:hypothetical protein
MMTELFGPFDGDDHHGFVRQLYKHVSNTEPMDNSDDLELMRSRYQKIKDFLSKSASVVGTIMASHNKEQICLGAKDTENVQLTIDDLQFLEPRGRFKLVLSNTTLFMEGKQASFRFPVDQISHMASVPSNASLKKEGEEFFVVRFSSPIKNNGKESRSVLMNLGKNINKPVSSSDGDTGIESDIVMKVLSRVSPISVIRPQRHLFASISQYKPFLRCYRGTQEGVIYPLENGVLFIKPSLFIAAEDIAQISAGRGGASGNTRYIDLKVIAMICTSAEQYFTSYCIQRLKNQVLHVSTFASPFPLQYLVVGLFYYCWSDANCINSLILLITDSCS